MKEMIGGCCVCSDESGWDENPLVYCDGDGCNVAVHQACYGIVTVPSGPWYCRKCESVDRNTKVRCELCPNKGGALKRTDTNSWAHVVCALYIPEVRFLDVTTMEPILVSMISAERFSKICCLCEAQGRLSKASLGACMNCNKVGCRQHFHVTCAQASGLLCEEQVHSMDNVTYCAYCPYHYAKLQRRGHTVKPVPAFRPQAIEVSAAHTSAVPSDTAHSMAGSHTATRADKPSSCPPGDSHDRAATVCATSQLPSVGRLSEAPSALSAVSASASISHHQQPPPDTVVCSRAAVCADSRQREPPCTTTRSHYRSCVTSTGTVVVTALPPSSGSGAVQSSCTVTGGQAGSIYSEPSQAAPSIDNGVNLTSSTPESCVANNSRTSSNFASLNHSRSTICEETAPSRGDQLNQHEGDRLQTLHRNHLSRHYNRHETGHDGSRNIYEEAGTRYHNGGFPSAHSLNTNHKQLAPPVGNSLSFEPSSSSSVMGVDEDAESADHRHSHAVDSVMSRTPVCYSPHAVDLKQTTGSHLTATVTSLAAAAVNRHDTLSGFIKQETGGSRHTAESDAVTAPPHTACPTQPPHNLAVRCAEMCVSGSDGSHIAPCAQLSASGTGYPVCCAGRGSEYHVTAEAHSEALSSHTSRSLTNLLSSSTLPSAFSAPALTRPNTAAYQANIVVTCVVATAQLGSKYTPQEVLSSRAKKRARSTINSYAVSHAPLYTSAPKRAHSQTYTDTESHSLANSQVTTPTVYAKSEIGSTTTNHSMGAAHMFGNHLSATCTVANFHKTLADEIANQKQAEIEGMTQSGGGAPVSRNKQRQQQSPTSGFPQSLCELLEQQWRHSSNFLMEQAQHFDIAALINCLHQLRSENQQLDEQLSSLTQRRDHLLNMHARLSSQPQPHSGVTGMYPLPTTVPLNTATPVTSRHTSSIHPLQHSTYHHHGNHQTSHSSTAGVIYVSGGTVVAQSHNRPTQHHRYYPVAGKRGGSEALVVVITSTQTPTHTSVYTAASNVTLDGARINSQHNHHGAMHQHHHTVDNSSQMVESGQSRRLGVANMTSMNTATHMIGGAATYGGSTAFHVPSHAPHHHSSVSSALYCNSHTNSATVTAAGHTVTNVSHSSMMPSSNYLAGSHRLRMDKMNK